MKKLKPLAITVIVLAVVAVGSLAIAAGIAAAGVLRFDHGAPASYTVDEKKTFAASGIDTVAVDGGHYDVRVTDSADASVNVRLYGTQRSLNNASQPRLVTNQAAGTLSIGTELGTRFSVSLQWDSIVLEVALPRSFKGDLAVRSSSGDLTIGDHALSKISLDTSSGDVSIGRISCAVLTASSNSGDIGIAGVDAQKTHIDSSSGDVKIFSLSGDLDSRSSSGDVSVDFKSGPGSSVIDVGSGNVHVRLPQTAGFALDARSSSGDVTCGLPVTVEESGRRDNILKGTVGTPGKSVLRIVTRSGDVGIEPAQ